MGQKWPKKCQILDPGPRNLGQIWAILTPFFNAFFDFFLVNFDIILIKKWLIFVSVFYTKYLVIYGKNFINLLVNISQNA